MPWKFTRDYNMADFQVKIWRGSYCLFSGKLVLLFQTYNIILYVHAFLFCWHFSYRTWAFCKARSDWLQLPLAALHINSHCVTSKIRLMMPRVKMSRADRNPWLAKMRYNWNIVENGVKHHNPNPNPCNNLWISGGLLMDCLLMKR